MLNPEDYFDAGDLGLSELNPRISVNISENDDEGNTHPAGTVTAVIEVSEDLKFHADLDKDSGLKEPALFTKEGELTDEAADALAVILEERYSGIDFTLSDAEGADAYFTFSITLDLPAETTVEDLGVKIWEETEVVKFHNEVDPGTFGSRYLFGSLMYEKLAEAAK